jgi:hypothetical protein
MSEHGPIPKEKEETPKPIHFFPFFLALSNLVTYGKKQVIEKPFPERGVNQFGLDFRTGHLPLSCPEEDDSGGYLAKIGTDGFGLFNKIDDKPFS